MVRKTIMRTVITMALFIVSLGMPALAKERGSLFSSCDSACDSSCDFFGFNKCCTGNWYLQTEAVFFAPISNVATQDFLLTDNIAAATVTPFASTLTADQFTMTPRLTFGTTFNNGWGIQGRYWEMNTVAGDGFAGPFTPTPLPDLNLVGGQNSLEAYTIDLEATKCFSFCNCSWLGTLGARHAALEHSTAGFAFGESVLNDVYTLSALSQDSFHGTGITYSLMGIRELPCKNFSLYGGGRLSNIFGTNSARASTTAVVASPIGGAASTDNALATGDDGLFIAEASAGLQWSHCLQGCNARCFARTGVEYQYWNAEDLTASATSFAGIFGSSNASVTANAVDQETQFIGLALSAGFMW